MDIVNLLEIAKYHVKAFNEWKPTPRKGFLDIDAREKTMQGIIDQNWSISLENSPIMTRDT